MRFLRYLLFPLAILYNIVTTIRNLMYDFGVFKAFIFDIPIIVVGNLNVGGTGKTPQIEYLVNILKDRYKLAVLSRGYKRRTKGFILLNSSNTALEVGDEPLQYAKKFDEIDVAVDEKRVRGIQKLRQLKSPEIILLDDAYQHRNVKGSFYVLLTKYNDLFIDDFLLPMGNLRESKSGAKRADVILITKCPKDLNKGKQERIKLKLSRFNKPVFFTTIFYGSILSKSKKMDIQELKGYTVLLITGIANPSPLLNFLTEKRINVHHLKFSDHHNFSKQEILLIEKRFDSIKSKRKILLTTEKDYTRLEHFWDHLYYLEIQTKFLDNQKVEFDNLIYRHVERKV